MRLFLATSFPAEVLRDLNARVSALKPRLPAASWVREEAQHLTFAFLGEQPESLVEAIAAPLTSALGALPRFEARLRAAGFFPHPRHARVGWVGLDPEEGFVDVARAVREVVTRHGVALDGGDFKPHLTMMRMRDRWPPASIDLFAKSLRDYASTPFAVEQVTLYSSRLDPKGAVHTPLRAFALA
ncbi:MAG TPA: RNA 2',3'-cyclic phosphodiesterase [Thermoanaerobaculia bacterium]|jgi:2'-5' RNA ligase